MFADIMKTPVETVKAKETGALGCAIAAACAGGEYDSLETAAKEMSAPGRRIEPDPQNYRYYDSRYHLYRKIIDQLDPVWDEMQRNIENRI